MSGPRDPRWRARDAAWFATEPGPAAPGQPPGADIWHVSLDADDSIPWSAARLLDARERTQAGRLRDAVASRRYVVAHVAARTVLGGYLGVAAYSLRWSTGPHGKPGFDGPAGRWQWSLSRSGGHALIAVCLAAPVGVDIERIGERTPALALAARFLPAEEAADIAARQDEAYSPRAMYHRLLSRKEACVKASGGRLLDGLDLRVLTPGPVVGSGRFAGERWTLRDLPAPPGFVAALAAVTASARNGTGPDTGTDTGSAVEPTGRLRFFEWAWRPPDQGPEYEAPAAREEEPP